MDGKPNCYECHYFLKVQGSAHSVCGNGKAHVTGAESGIKKGWFNWPYNFDPVWLESCDGFFPKPIEVQPTT